MEVFLQLVVLLFTTQLSSTAAKDIFDCYSWSLLLIAVFINIRVMSKMRSYGKGESAYLYASVPRAIHRSCYRSEAEE